LRGASDDFSAHFIPEEAPEELAGSLRDFLSGR
jgi:hypothetical protein